MEKIVIAGLFNALAIKLDREQLPNDFTLQIIGLPDKHETLVNDIAGADYLIVRGKVPIDKAVLEHAQKLKLIQKWGVGYDQYNMELIGSYNIPFLNCAGVNAVQVSEMALAMTLALYRYIPFLSAQYKKGISLKEQYLPLCHTIEGKTVGIIGIGNIGKRVAHLMRACGAKIQYYDLFRLSPQAELAEGLTYTELPELYRTSDIISLHVPLVQETKHMINQNALAMMKPSAIIVNTSRGEVICEEDLYHALVNKKLAGAALDVLADENPEAAKKNPLMQLENVIITPHIGASTEEITQLQVTRCFQNILKIRNGDFRDPATFLNGKYLKKCQINF